MKGLTLRGLKIYFRDKGGVFFSLLGVLIIFALFIFFIGDSIIEDLDWLDNSKSIMNAWVVAGMLASASITTSMGAYAQMVTDRDQKIIKDFYTSPISRASITASYMLTGFIVSVIMSVIVLVIGEAYICVKGGELLGALTYLKIFGVMLLSSFASSAMVCFIVSFMRTMASYTTVSIILGTLIGFLVGSYIPIGQLPAGVQNVIRYFPCAHSAALFRHLMMDGLSDVSFAALPAAQRAGFDETLGVRFTYGSTVAPAWVSIAILVGTGVVFYLLAILNMSRKRKK